MCCDTDGLGGGALGAVLGKSWLLRQEMAYAVIRTNPPIFLDDVLCGDPTLRKRFAYRLAPGADVYLGVDVSEVALDRRLRDRERGCYLTVGEAAGCAEQDLQFPL